MRDRLGEEEKVEGKKYNVNTVHIYKIKKIKNIIYQRVLKWLLHWTLQLWENESNLSPEAAINEL